MDNISEVEYKNTLKSVALENKIINLISSQIKKDFNDLSAIKFNIDMIQDICCCIEDLVDEHKLKGVNKYELFIKIYNSIFGTLSQDDIKIIKEVINYLHQNEKIKVRPLSKKLWKRFKPFFQRSGIAA